MRVILPLCSLGFALILSLSVGCGDRLGLDPQATPASTTPASPPEVQVSESGESTLETETEKELESERTSGEMATDGQFDMEDLVSGDASPNSSGGSADSNGGTLEPNAPGLADLRSERDNTVWQKERLAQEYERAIVSLWDRLLHEQRKGKAGNPLTVFAALTMDSIRVGSPGAAQELGWGVTTRNLDDAPTVLGQDEWKELVGTLQAAGYEIEQTEWHHATFDMDQEGVAKSTIRMAVYGTHPSTSRRWVLGGNLLVQWHPRHDAKSLPIAKTIDATELRVYEREGPAPFQELLTIDHAQPNTRSGVQPISVHDFNGDGLNEIVLAGSNELFWNRGDFKFEKDQFLSHPERGFEVSLLADVTGDGVTDFLYPGINGDLLMYEGDKDGRFTSPPKGKARGGGPLKQPQVVAAGDIDNDGDIDLWIGQYRISYMGGQMPTPYYDANDGYEAYLLINEGGGQFRPATEEAGLTAKRRRRSYGGSFVDLDGDADLDLIVVSDFAGVDVYLNDGRGRFTDVTDTILDERHLFGMSASFSDYNVDGQLDFFVTGMASTTARRLDHMGLGREDRPEIHKMRSIMGYGNRMYLANAAKSFHQPAFIENVARTGWSWGSTSFDFDNDGYPDIFVANGHSSGKSTKDHCSHFWCHDIYDATSQPNREVFNVFQDSMKGYFDRSESWDGYQKNQLLANQQGEGFVNIGYLMGVGHEFDGRAVISDDLDNDGRLDLLVVEDQWQDGQLVHVFRNSLETNHNWIGLNLIDVVGPDSPLGANVLLTLDNGETRTACVTVGDSIHAQHASMVHFGLGSNVSVKSLKVRLVSGKEFELKSPAANRYHRLEIQ